MILVSQPEPHAGGEGSGRTLSSPTGPSELLTTLAMVCAARTGWFEGQSQTPGHSNEFGGGRRTVLVPDFSAGYSVSSQEKT